VDNILADNGLSGGSARSFAVATVADNMIVGNHIPNNGADTADTATPGPTGIMCPVEMMEPASRWR
jgi:hypothetical protein